MRAISILPIGNFAFTLVLMFSGACQVGAAATERTERFDREPGWESHNNRAAEPAPREVRQDFGYSNTSHAGGKPGEIGGFITPAAEPAYYAAKLDETTFDQPLSAAGVLASSERPFHLLLGFFNSGTLNEWRTPNSIALRLSGRGEVFYAWIEYCTSKWRAGGDDPRGFPTIRDEPTGRMQLKGFDSRRPHRWSLSYDPRGNGGLGVVTASIDDEQAICNLAPGHKQDGASFNRFGLLTLMKSADSGGEFWMDDVTINGRFDDFSRDPLWDSFHSRRQYTSTVVRPRFDFGFSPTTYAGGKSAGELGGLVFRGDCRYPARMASYADRLDNLTLDKPLKAAGKVALRRGVTDSGVLIGFFDSQKSMTSNPSQTTGLPDGFFGISTDAPSREGFYFSPAYRIGKANGSAGSRRPPYLHPDGQSHDWTFDYSPTAGDGQGEIVVTLDRQSVQLPLVADARKGAHFDRFGIITTWVDGNSQTIYFDDLVYTSRQD